MRAMVIMACMHFKRSRVSVGLVGGRSYKGGMQDGHEAKEASQV